MSFTLSAKHRHKGSELDIGAADTAPGGARTLCSFCYPLPIPVLVRTSESWENALMQALYRSTRCAMPSRLGGLSVLFTLLLSLLLGACASGFRDDDSVMRRASDYFKAQQVQRTDQADPSNLPVQVNYAVHRKPVLQQVLSIDFEFVPQQASPYLGVGIRVSEGLAWEQGARQFSYADVQPFEVHEHGVRIRPVEEGHFFVEVVVVMQVDGEYRAKSLQIPVSLGVNQQPQG